MRAADTALLGGASYDVYWRVWLDGFLLDFSLGFDPMLSATWTASVDQLATLGDLTLARIGPMLKSHTAFGQTWPQAGRHFELQTATVPKGAIPSGWQTVWDGRVDGADTGAGETVRLTCRDMMALFLNRIIEPPVPPSTVNGFLVESQPLGNHLAAIREAVYIPAINPSFIEQRINQVPMEGIGSAEWTVQETWVEYGKNLAEQLSFATLQRGWSFHYRSNNSAGRFVYYDPLRDTPTTDYTVQPGEVLRVTRCTINDQDVTNVWDLIYGKGAARTRIRDQDDFSIHKYGRRFGSWPEPQESAMNEAVEAERMLLSMILDTKDPIIELDYERHYFWPVELGDKHTVAANGIQTDLTLDLAVTGYTHTLTPTSMRSVIRTRGAPVAARRRWKRGVAKTVHVSLDDPTGIGHEGDEWYKVDDLTPAS